MTAPASLGLSSAHPELGAELRRRLDDVEAALLAAVHSDDDAFVSETAEHLVRAGGKRLRPLLTLLAAQLGDPDAPGVVPAAVVVELTHLATLYHDDVMDEAPLRRGAVSANTRWGNTVAILTGDYLFARASDLLADLGPEAVRLQARTFQRLVQGQLRETVGPQDGEDAVAHHLRVLADKTGSLIGTSARFGAMLAGAEREVVEVLAAYGERIGVAFQLSDDVLDIASETADSGKTPGTDLREGVRTLPVLLALRDDDPAGARLRELVAGPVAEADVAEALALLRSSSALAAARAEARRWAEQARALLDPLPPGRAVDALRDLALALADRTA